MSGAFLKSYGLKYPNSDCFNKMQDICILPSGNIAITERMYGDLSHYIQVFEQRKSWV
jgi:hypothetical protein